ncbi:MAG: Bax inhibitor-1 family protein, partial [Myxococcota bacterium]|nr:Bax inhibitor-1 family protein [Myxococcota bacterium]
MLSTDTFWNRREAVGDEIDDRTYNLIIGGVLLWGFFLNFWMVQNIPAELVMGINQWVFMGGYFLCVIAGSVIYTRSDNPVVSFMGYNLVVLPLGLVLVRMLPFFDQHMITQAFLQTGAITGMMMILATANPKFFLGLGRTLFIALICTVVVEVGLMIFMGGSPAIMSWIVVGIFSAYIGYDWARAQSLPKTADNAVDCAAALYMDIIILFIRL